jgi:hypothetical protein
MLVARSVAIDTSSSPVKGMARMMGISPEAVTLSGVFQFIQTTHRELRMQSYSTQNEVDIGKKLVANVNVLEQNEEHPTVTALDIPQLLVAISMEEETRYIELPPDGNITSTMQEDVHVNAPLFNHLLLHVPPQMKLLLTVSHSAFIDVKGREQRCDMVLLQSLLEEWPHVVTMFEGKLNLMRDFYELLGQARRRAAAVLSAQPWRRCVDIIMFDLTHIAVFRLNCDGVNAFTTVPIDFLSHVGGNRYECRYGYYLLLDYIKHPQKLGFVQCPLRLLNMHTLLEHAATAELVCGRSKGKAVFVMNVGKVNVVAKVFQNEEDADHERQLLKQVQSIDGTARLHSSCLSETLQCEIEVNVPGRCEREHWYGFAVLPYCTVLVPSRARPHHFAAVATTIFAAFGIGLVCNDISLDNLLHDSATNKVIISDWGLATPPCAHIGSSGKRLFIPPSCRIEDGSIDLGRVASARSDLFALLLVAVCCALSDVPWACAKTDRETNDQMLDACGLGRLRGRSSELHDTEWAYLLNVARVLIDATQSDLHIVEAFSSFE